MELEILYRELPGVLKGDHAAMTHLREILDQTVRRGIGSKGIGLERRGSFGFTPGPNPLPSPCQPRLLVKPYIISFIIGGIDRIAQGNKAVYESYINTLG